METIALLAFPAAIIAAAGAFFVEKNRMIVCAVIGYMLCAVPVLYGSFDTGQQESYRNLLGEAELSQIMTVSNYVLLGIVSVLIAGAYIMRRRK